MKTKYKLVIVKTLHCNIMENDYCIIIHNLQNGL
jgi:hypothetical protein